MNTTPATHVDPDHFALKAVRATARLLSYGESIALRSSLLITLTEAGGEVEAIERAVSRAFRSIESHRLGYRSSFSDAEAAELAEVRAALEAVTA